MIPEVPYSFEFVRLLKECKPKYFLLENVRMKKIYQDVISEHLGVEPIMINSSLLSAQSRHRLYWTNIPNVQQPQDKGLVIKDILEDLPFDDPPNYLNGNFGGRTRGSMVSSVEDAKANCLTASMWKGQIPTYIKKPIRVGTATDIRGFDCIKRVYSEEGKSPTLTTMQGGHREPKVMCGAFRGRYNEEGKTEQQLEIRKDEKTNSITTVQKDNVVTKDKMYYRKLTPIECERLQTVPDNYTQGVSNTQRYKMLGNGWTVDVIAHILKNINEENNYTLQTQRTATTDSQGDAKI
jgi:site-specific DNA-cytosine methylase